MIARPMRYAPLVISLTAVAAAAQQPVTAPAFRFERPIVTGGAGPRRLPVDIPLLAGAAPGLRDLRIFDASGVEVEYLTIGNTKPAPTLTTPVDVERRPSEPERSRFRLRLPGGHLPIVALHFDVGGNHVFRDVKVLEALTARYGNTTLTAPRYDLEAAREQIHIDAVPNAAWGEPRARNAEDAAASTASPLPTVGASLDPGLFRYVRTIPAGNAGLAAVGLDAAVLAHSAGPDRGFADLRVADTGNRQIPYVVERTAEPLSFDLAVDTLSTPPTTLLPARSGRSVYRVRYPINGLPAARVVLTTTARVFERRVSVAEEREPDRQRHRDRWIETLATVRWVHADQDKPAMPLTLDVPPLHAAELLVIVEEGDNAALPLAGARLLLPSYRLRLFREANAPLRIVYGRSGESTPQYDLPLLATQVLGARATEVTLDAEQPVRSSREKAAFASPRLFWGALVAAVIVLLGLIARLLKNESAS